MSRTKSTEVVSLSHRAFAAWWLLILVVQVVTCFYNAIYAYYYWILQDAYLNVILESFVIGMPPPYHHTLLSPTRSCRLCMHPIEQTRGFRRALRIRITITPTHMDYLV
ncbi:hypothetical protein JG688_00013038 [Phytophthora aleatoria]|uniref:Uncharacterized protein n=1 Tax=Phytophthora aleatoria TaxID=2496075 RepID=A0A8J5IE89_9STRA|nr:hypothetical protein JG688_00013038 [Phytophthora aleatoria]